MDDKFIANLMWKPKIPSADKVTDFLSIASELLGLPVIPLLTSPINFNLFFKIILSISIETFSTLWDS